MKIFCRSLFLLVLTFTCLSASAYINSISKSNNSPSVCNNFSITVNGDLPGSNYIIQSSNKSISGNTITINIYITSDGIGIPVLTPYSVSKNFSKLDAASYTIIANDYIDGSFSSSMTSSITVSGFTSATTTNITNTTATLNWSQINCSCNYLLKGRIAGGTFTDYNISGSTNTTLNASGLAPGTTYEWRVFTDCSTSGLAKTAIISFTTTNCVPPNPASTTNITSSSATLNWAQKGGVGYELWGREIGGPIVKIPINNITTTSYNATSLPVSTTFQWAVRTKCSAAPNDYSGFSSIQSFSTTEQIAKVSVENSVSINPNPMASSAVISLPESEQPYSITIMDLSGKIVMTIAETESYKVEIHRDDFVNGLYLYSVFNDDVFYSGKLMVY
ncbi:MAG: T9SS type A sorting domain-containing protein [Chitinophagales bacterium]|nr:T9SS type A sorting domain-containing protein [Chitinophagales bacterium]